MEEVLLESTGKMRFFNRPVLRNILVLVGLGCLLVFCFISNKSETSISIMLCVFVVVLLLLLLSFALEFLNQGFNGMLIINNDGLTLFVKNKAHFVARNQIRKLVIGRPVNEMTSNKHSIWGNHIEIIRDGEPVSLYLSAVSDDSIKKLISFKFPVVYDSICWLEEPTGKLFSDMLGSLYLLFS